MTPSNNRKIAFIYDFDGTLIDTESLDNFICDELGYGTPGEFWSISNEFAQRHKLDRISAFMLVLCKKCEERGKLLDRGRLEQIGKSISMREGLLPQGEDKGWFDSINDLAKEHGLEAEHFVITSGLAEIVEACPISDKLRMVFGSRLLYMPDSSWPTWPAHVVNHTNKTQYLFRINKGALDITDDTGVNLFMDKDSRPMPFSQMVFVGDGYTDIPCFSLIKQNSGWAIAMLKGKEVTDESIRQVQTLVNDNRVDAISLERSFGPGSTMMKLAGRIVKDMGARLPKAPE